MTSLPWLLVRKILVGSCETIGVECKGTRGGCESNRNSIDIIESATYDNAE